MSSALLWQNDERTVCLIDVPGSISEAQGNAEHPCSDTLLSCEPGQFQFPSNEPKAAAAKAKLQRNTVQESLHAEYSIILQQAIEQVRQHYRGLWCLPRRFVGNANRTPKKRKRQRVQDVDDKINQLAPHLTSPALPKHVLFHANESGRTDEFRATSIDDEVVHEIYRIPPHSTFSLSDCSSSTSFMSSIRNQAQDDSTRRSFDLMIFDPPWPNRSVKRSHKTPWSTYATPTTLDDVFQLMLGTDLDMLMADDCLVGFWITNKNAVRELVCGDGGIFETWGVELEEEWVWLKTTVSGEPVTRIDSLWRKPYEVLLLGRRRPSVSKGGVVERKAIIGVPDLHSRKPCLKALLEPLMHDPQNYRALEVFARHLVASWWSWGNECLKFNWGGFWRPQVGNMGKSE